MSNNETPAPDYRTIHGLSERRVLPRLGKIRLGEKRKNKRGKVYPVSLPFFRFDEESIAAFPAILDIFGDPPQPTELDVLLPVEDRRIVFPQANKCYGGSKLKCKGNGREARRRVCKACLEAAPEAVSTNPAAMRCRDHAKAGEEMVTVTCPCPLLEARECSPVGSLMVMLPSVSMAGVWQVDTHSPNNIVALNSAIEFTRAVFGRVSMVPLKLRRGERDTVTPEGKPTTVHTLELRFAGGLDEVRRLRDVGPTSVAALVAAPRDDGDDRPPVEIEDAPPGRPDGPHPATAPHAAGPSAGPPPIAPPIALDAIVGAVDAVAEKDLLDELDELMRLMGGDLATIEATVAPEFTRRNLDKARPKVQLKQIVEILRREYEQALAAGEIPPGQAEPAPGPMSKSKSKDSAGDAMFP